LRFFRRRKAQFVTVGIIKAVAHLEGESAARDCVRWVVTFYFRVFLPYLCGILVLAQHKLRLYQSVETEGVP
jgi:hypothetical protein